MVYAGVILSSAQAHEFTLEPIAKLWVDCQSLLTSFAIGALILHLT